MPNVKVAFIDRQLSVSRWTDVKIATKVIEEEVTVTVKNLKAQSSKKLSVEFLNKKLSIKNFKNKKKLYMCDCNKNHSNYL